MSGSFYTLNAKYNTLQAEINKITGGGGVPTSSDLADVLTNGDDAGGLDITNLNNLDVVTINGSAYPPVVASDTLQDVLDAGNTANQTITLDTGSSITALLQSTSLAFSNPTTDVAGNYTGSGFTLQTDTTPSSAVGVASLYGTAVNTGGIISSISGSCVGNPSPPYPAPDASWSVSVAGASGTPSVYLQKSAPFTNSTSMTLDLNNLLHNQGTGSPSPNDDFTISTNKNLILTGDNVDLSATGRLIVPSLASADYLDYNAGILNLKTDNAGYTTNQILYMENTLATAGSTIGVPSVQYYKSGRNGAVNDVIFSEQYYAKDYTGTKTAFGKTECVITNTSAVSGNDSALDFYTAVNGASSLVMRLNGADNENNSFRPLDMNGNDIKTSSGNMLITTTASSGTGTLGLASKNSLTLGSNTDNIILNNNTTVAVDKQINLSKSGANVYQGIVSADLVQVSNLSSQLYTNLVESGLVVNDANPTLQPPTYYNKSGFYNSDNSIYCNTANGFVLNYGSAVNKTTVDLSKVELYNTGANNQDTILLQNTGTANPVLNLQSNDSLNNITSSMGASVATVGLSYQDNISFGTRSLTLTNTGTGNGSLSYNDGITATNHFDIISNTNLQLTIGQDFVLSGSNLLSGTAGGNSGQHLVLTINGSPYKIALLNP